MLTVLLGRREFLCVQNCNLRIRLKNRFHRRFFTLLGIRFLLDYESVFVPEILGVQNFVNIMQIRKKKRGGNRSEKKETARSLVFYRRKFT